MPLAEKQKAKIDELIANNKKRPDIINHLVGKMLADAREVEKYLTDNKTLQGMLNTITRRATDILSAGTEVDRRTIVNEIVALAKNGIKMLQKKAGQ